MKKESASSMDRKLTAFENKWNKKAGHTVIRRGDSVPNTYAIRRPSGIMQLDLDMGGGAPSGGMIKLAGPDNCIDEDTYIQYKTTHADGRTSNSKGGTIRKLYRRFHNLPDDKKRRGYIKEQPKDVQFSAPSVDDDGSIFHNRIVDVVCTGTKECFELITEGGHRIVATAKHKFMTPAGYTRLAKLEQGSTVFIHNNTTRKKTKRSQCKRRPETVVKHHPTLPAQARKISKRGWSATYYYCRAATARFVIEAAMNELPLEEYIRRCNKNELNGLKSLSSNQIVHHIDEDTTNNSLDNLMVITRAEHMMEHWDYKRVRDMSFTIIQDRVSSIRCVGKRNTYDLKMAAPFHNYVANKFAVHNSGKTYIMNLFIAMNQKIRGDDSRVAIAYTEWKPDHSYMRKQSGVRLGLPNELISIENKHREMQGLPSYTKAERAELTKSVGKIHFIHADAAETTLDIVLDAVAEEFFDIICIDSLTMLEPAGETKKDLEDSANVRNRAAILTQFQTKLHGIMTGLDNLNKTTIIAVDQVRANTNRALANSWEQKFIPAHTDSSPWAGKHGSMITIMLTEGRRDTKDVTEIDEIAKDNRRKNKTRKRTVAKYIKWEFLKGSKGCHNHVSGEVKYTYKTGIDLVSTIIVPGIASGIIQEKEGIYYVKKASGDMLLEGIDGQKELLDRLRADHKLEMEVRLNIIAANGHTCLYDDGSCSFGSG
jgi:RecA/RadA recombinase